MISVLKKAISIVSQEKPSDSANHRTGEPRIFVSDLCVVLPPSLVGDDAGVAESHRAARMVQCGVPWVAIPLCETNFTSLA